MNINIYKKIIEVVAGVNPPLALSMIKVSCPDCGHKMDTDKDPTKDLIKCPNCGEFMYKSVSITSGFLQSVMDISDDIAIMQGLAKLRGLVIPKNLVGNPELKKRFAAEVRNRLANYYYEDLKKRLKQGKKVSEEEMEFRKKDLEKSGKAMFKIGRVTSSYWKELGKWLEGKKFKNPETGNMVEYDSLPDKEQEKVRRNFSALQQNKQRDQIKSGKVNREWVKKIQDASELEVGMSLMSDKFIKEYKESKSWMNRSSQALFEVREKEIKIREKGKKKLGDLWGKYGSDLESIMKHIKEKGSSTVYKKLLEIKKE